MKTAVSIPDDVFAEAEHLARRLAVSRSQLYSDALREFVARHSPDAITEALNAACEEAGVGADDFVASASRSTLRRAEW